MARRRVAAPRHAQLSAHYSLSFHENIKPSGLAPLVRLRALAWGGFKRTVDARRNELFCRNRIWGLTQLVDALLKTYERLPEEFRAELALCRIWTLVPDEGGEAP